MHVPLRSSLALALAGLCATAALAVPSAAGAATPTTTSGVAAAAAGWLAQQFSNADNERVAGGDHIELSYNDGTKDVFYFDGGGTADAAFALAATGSGKTKIDTAVTYLAAHLDEYVDYGGTNFGPYDGSIGKAALAAIVDGRNPTAFGGHNLLKELKDNECATGSTTCTPGNNRNIFSSVATSFIMLAEARGAATYGATYAPSANLTAFLLSLQCADGGFSSAIPAGTGSACAPDVDATGYAVMALQALGGHRAAIDNAADYLESTRGTNGAWSSNGGTNIDSTGLAAAALEIDGRSAATSRAWLASQQVTDGPTVGTGSRRGALKYQGAYDANSSIKGTSDGILGLVKGASLATLTATGATPGTAVLALDNPTLKHRSVQQGGTQTVTGTGFGAGETVRAVVHSTPVSVGSAKASSDGTVSVTFTVPTSLAAGRHTVVLTGATTALTSSVAFTVTASSASASASPTDTLPVTSDPASSSAPVLAATGRDGRQTRAEVVLGVGLLLVGGFALALGRRRGRRA